MKFFRIIKNLASPRKFDFIKRLAIKRKECAENQFLVGSATYGTDQYTFRRLGLEKIDFLATPEATIATVLEHYQKLLRVRSYFWERGHEISLLSEPERSEREIKFTAEIIGAIEYSITKIPDAAVHLPPDLTLHKYMRYRMREEHPTIFMTSEDGYTDEFLDYAISESKYVFKD